MIARIISVLTVGVALCLSVLPLVGIANAGTNKTIKTIAGKLEIVEVKKQNDNHGIPAVNQVLFNGRSIKKFSGNDANITKVFSSNDATVVLVSYGTYGNHCSATQEFAIGVSKSKKYRLFEDANFSLCNVEDFTSASFLNGIKLSWRSSVSEVRNLVYDVNNNNFNFSAVAQYKDPTPKDLDALYSVYQLMCKYDEYTPQDLKEYEMSPNGYYMDKYVFYQDIIEGGKFKILCHDLALNQDHAPLSKENFIAELVEYD